MQELRFTGFLSDSLTVQTCFLVGGLGSSLYLLDFLRSRLMSLEVKQPDVRSLHFVRLFDLFSYTAIMKGAVLYKLGLDLVRTRVMRSSYGTEIRVTFKEGVHPEYRKVYDYDRLPRCDGYMYWFAKKVFPSFGRYLTYRVFPLKAELLWRRAYIQTIIRVLPSTCPVILFGYANRTTLLNTWRKEVFWSVGARTHFSDEAKCQAHSGSQRPSAIRMGNSEGYEWHLSKGPL